MVTLRSKALLLIGIAVLIGVAADAFAVVYYTQDEEGAPECTPGVIKCDCSGDPTFVQHDVRMASDIEQELLVRRVMKQIMDAIAEKLAP